MLNFIHNRRNANEHSTKVPFYLSDWRIVDGAVRTETISYGAYIKPLIPPLENYFTHVK